MDHKRTAGELFDAIAAYIGKQLEPLTTRLASHSHRFDVIEERVVELGAKHKATERGLPGVPGYGKDGSQGLPGPQGPKGEPGRPPAHHWDGTALSFENADGTFDEPVDLRGPQGEPGKRGRGGGGVGATPPVQHGYFPQGW
jgi:hypothetical protein